MGVRVWGEGLGRGFEARARASVKAHLPRVRQQQREPRENLDHRRLPPPHQHARAVGPGARAHGRGEQLASLAERVAGEEARERQDRREGRRRRRAVGSIAGRRGRISARGRGEVAGGARPAVGVVVVGGRRVELDDRVAWLG